jgi:tetratricopeptide (TPR) repeat protein
VIRINPKYADNYYNRGLIKQEKGERQEALVDFRKTAEFFQQQGNMQLYSKSGVKIKELGE